MIVDSSAILFAFSKIAIHVDEEAYNTGSKLLIAQKKVGSEQITVTEYRNGKVVAESKEYLDIPDGPNLQKQFLQYFRYVICFFSLKLNTQFSVINSPNSTLLTSKFKF